MGLSFSTHAASNRIIQYFKFKTLKEKETLKNERVDGRKLIQVNKPRITRQSGRSTFRHCFAQKFMQVFM
jgi:hypothetical protein